MASYGLNRYGLYSYGAREVRKAYAYAHDRGRGQYARYASVMAYTGMAYTVMAHRVMASIVMA